MDDLPSLPVKKASPVVLTTDVLEVNSSLSKQSYDLLDLDDLPSLSQKELSPKNLDYHEFDSLPSTHDFFDQLISQKRDRPIVEIDDDEDEPLTNPNGKRKTTDDMVSSREKKRLEVDERKQQRADAAEAKRIQKEQKALEKQRLKEQKQVRKKKYEFCFANGLNISLLTLVGKGKDGTVGKRKSITPGSYSDITGDVD